jgi:hypothetical protein
MEKDEFAKNLNLINWKLNERYQSLKRETQRVDAIGSESNLNAMASSESAQKASPDTTEGIQLVLTQKEFNLLQANNSSIKRFINDIIAFYGTSKLKVASENEPLDTDHVVFCGCEEGEERKNNFFTLEQIFFHPPRKKTLFNYLNHLDAEISST